MSFASPQKTNTRTWRSVLAITLTILVGGSAIDRSAYAKDNSFVCNHPDVKGGWGALWKGCDADQFGEIDRIESIYPMFVFDRRIQDDDHQHEKEYITNMVAIIRTVAHQYYLKRNPGASAEEVAGFERAAVSIGAHESMLSHYRMAVDNRYKLMTGDALVSHGVMQVNQEFHANKDLDSSFDLVGNISASLDTYYVEWNRAVKEGCFAAANGKAPSAQTMLLNRARSAYSAYNGGGGKLCRFLDKKDYYKENDADFLEMYETQPYGKYVTDWNRKSPVNTQCIIDGDDLCAMAKPQRDHYMKSRPLVLEDGKTCMTSDGTNYTCATDMRIFSCLAKIDPDALDNDPIKLKTAPPGTKITMVEDRGPLCKKAVQALYDVGTRVVIQKEMVLRTTIGGAPFANTKVGHIYQIEDYDLRLGAKTDRYYKIKTSNGADAWLYGGNNEDHDSWLKTASEDDVKNADEADAKSKAEQEAKIAAARAAALAAKARAAQIAKAKADAEAKAATKTNARPGINTTPITIIETPQIVANLNAEQAQADLDVTTALQELSKIKSFNPDADDTKPIIPIAGMIFEIVKSDGIVLRATPGESEDAPFVKQLYRGARFTIEETKVIGTDNRMYLKITDGAAVGWVYCGRTYPDVTITKWIKLWN